MSSVVTLQPPAAVYREEQYFDWRVYALIALVGLLTGLGLLRGRIWSGEVALGLMIGLAFLMFMVVFVLHMTTEVAATGLCVCFGWAPTYPRIVSIDTIRSVEVVNYRPIADYGFWGVRAGRDGEKAFIARGTRGVRIELIDGTKLLVGSQRPEVLASVLDGALRPGA
jgi:hypothetical protein